MPATKNTARTRNPLASVIANLVAVSKSGIKAERVLTNEHTDKRLTDAILTSLAVSEGREAVSFLHRQMREDGWMGLGTLADFEKLCCRLGFVVYDGRNYRNQRTRFVAVDEPSDEG